MICLARYTKWQTALYLEWDKLYCLFPASWIWNGILTRYFLLCGGWYPMWGWEIPQGREKNIDNYRWYMKANFELFQGLKKRKSSFKNSSFPLFTNTVKPVYNMVCYDCCHCKTLKLPWMSNINCYKTKKKKNNWHVHFHSYVAWHWFLCCPFSAVSAVLTE